MICIHLLLVVCTALSVSAYSGTLQDCDDCSTSKIPLNDMKIYFHDESFAAYQVESNGYICLFSTANSSQSCYSHQFKPVPIIEAEGAVFISPFWNDIDLRCTEDGANFVQYEEKVIDSETLHRIQQQTGSGFRPDYYVRVFYDNVKEFPCKDNPQSTNSFEVLIATETREMDTRVIFTYGAVEWMKYVPITIGYGDGDCRGQVGFRPPPTTARDVAHQTRLFRVTDPLYGPRCEQPFQNKKL